MTDFGKRAEELVQTICTRMFFSDFTVTNPKYTKTDRNQKEAADILVPFRDVLIAFQVKSKEEKRLLGKTSVDYGRITKKCEDGIDQLKTIKRALANNRFSNLKTVKGYDIPFHCAAVKKTIGVVILDLIGEERVPLEERTSIWNGFTVKFGMPIHVFVRQDFETISNELDTMPDFLKYLEVREKIRSREKSILYGEELDFLTLYKTNWPLVEDLLNEKVDCMYVDSGLWESYQKKEQLHKDRSGKNRSSYLVDQIIDYLHTSVGYRQVDFNPHPEKSNAGIGSVENYVGIITELASFSRLQRREIGDLLLEKAKKADSSARSYGLLIFPEEERGIVVLCSNEEKRERIEKLYQLCAMAYCKYRLKRIVGLALNSLKELSRSTDALILDGVSFENDAELALEADRAFRAGTEVAAREF
jgi:hypothetical protein